MQKRICFIAQFPPPMHGLSKAVDTLYNSYLNEEYSFEKIDIKNNRKIFSSLWAILRSNADLFYFTISQSRGGNIRDLIIMELLRLQKKKCLIHLHGGYYRQLVNTDMPSWQRKANYAAVKGIEGAIVLSRSLTNIFAGMLSENKIFIVPNCVDDEYLMTDTDFEKKMASLNTHQVKHVLYLSNFIRSKGYCEVLEMAKLEKERVEAGGDRRFHFNFAGKFFEKTEENFFFEYIRKHALETYVTYHGVVDGNQKRDLLKLCSVFVLLTRYPNEGQPISILEAMGNGMMIVTTDHAGIPDVVKNGKNGLVKSMDKSVYSIYQELTQTDIIPIAKRNREEIQLHYLQKYYLSHMKAIFEKVCY